MRIRAVFLDEVIVVEENMRAIGVFIKVAAWTRIEPIEIPFVSVNLAVVHELFGELAAGLEVFQNDSRLVQLVVRNWLARFSERSCAWCNWCLVLDHSPE